MPPRRGAPSFNTLSPQDAASFPSSDPSSPANLLFPRSTSPSSGFSSFLSKSSKWFGRKPSDPRYAPGPPEPRSSTSSVGRKPKISRPTDPRPILSSFQSDSHVSNNASKSALDLSTQSQASPDFSRPFPSSQPSSPDTNRDLGDLRSVSRKGWSKSADDLGTFSSPQYSPVDVSFQHRVHEYRNRSNSSATLYPTSPNSNTAPARHPFPSIVTSMPLSTSPPDISTMPEGGISISVSSPTTSEAPTPTEAQFHNRTTSFTPRLPSKLSASKLGFSPASPKRKGSGDGDSIKDRERDADRGVVGNNMPARGVFPFGLSGISSTKQHSMTSVTSVPSIGQTTNITHSPALLAPPTMSILGEEDEGLRDSKRTSQIVYHSGFINRLADAPPSQYRNTVVNLTSSKAWKSFKAELKGSKMYFYKPPNDRNAAIKELFPTECVPVIDEDEEVEVEGDGEGAGLGKGGRARDEGTAGRKKRAYWGRRTHPALVHSEAGVEKGTFEALIHEGIFATTFMISSDHHQTISDNRRPEWKDFSSAILLCLPVLAGHAKFENEFTRCCAYLVSGADDDVKEAERSRVAWLADEYLRYHGTPNDEAGWNEWASDTIPDFSWNASGLNTISGFPKSSSTQALYVPSPNVSMISPAMGSTAFSPNLATFSPRPDENAKLASLMEALGGAEGMATPGSPSAKLTGTMRQNVQQAFANIPPVDSRLWTLLDQDGLSREVLSMLDPRDIAESLRLFHHNVLQNLPGNMTSSDIIGSVDGSNGHHVPTALFGSEAHPHWLTKLLLVQILVPDTSGGGGGGGGGSSAVLSQTFPSGRVSEERNAQTSRTHSRSEVITIWIRVGEMSRKAGDECSWQAIFSALCSRPVARLDKVWKRVDRLALATIESWVYPGMDGNITCVNQPLTTPWGGDIKDSIKETLDQAREGGEDGWTMNQLLKARDMFESLRRKVSLCPRMTDPARDTASQEVQKLVTLWQEFSDETSNRSNLPVKYQRIDEFMSLSLAAEPRRKGLFEPYFWSHTMSSPHTMCHSLIPLLFAEPLPTVSLIDRGQIWRGRIESNPTRLNLQELQTFGALDTSLRSINEQNFDPSNSMEKLYSVGGVDLRGTAIPVYDGELLLVVQSNLETSSASRPPSRAPSRPPSSVIDGSITEKPMARAPSIRVKPGSSHGLDRKSSLARRNSLPSISPRPNFVVTEHSSEKPLRVLVQAGTLDRLVHVLIHGLQGVSVAVSDDNGETSLREGRTRDLVVDRMDFARVWWNIFRSFVTPIVFFELLRKRYIISKTPNNPALDILGIIRIRSEVLEAIKEWITFGGGGQDCLDDVQLYATVRTFLDRGAEHSLPDVDSSDEPAVFEAWSALEKSRTHVFITFESNTMRPPTRSIVKSRTPVGSRTRSFGKEAPDIDRISPEEFVDNIDAMAGAAFSNVSEEDLFITSDLLEVQSADRTGWFPTRDIPSTDDVEIQTMYSHILEIEPSSMISELSQDVIYRILPPSIRSCIRAYTILRKWLTSKLVAPRLGLRLRQKRMDFCLRAIEIARLRHYNGPVVLGCADQPCVRSFVEAVVVSAVISVESRMHHRAWQNVAVVRGAQCDSLTSLLSRPTSQRRPGSEALVVDMSWLLERMLEIVSIPNAVTSSPEDNQNIINLDKRRHLCNFIQNNPSLSMLRPTRQREDIDRKDFERLNNIEKEVTVLHFDHKFIKDEAHREALQASVNGTSSAKKAARPFQKLVVVQQEKNKRDRHLRDRLSKEKKQEQQRNDKRDDYLNKAMRPRKPVSQLQKQHRNKKSMSSAFFQLMRPISSAFTDNTYPTIKRSPAELDFSPSGKPSLVLSIVDAKVAQFINNDRSFTFQLDTEDGGHYLLQAISRREMIFWIDHINRVAKIAAKRRLTYLGNSPKPQLSDHIHNQPVATSASRDPTAVFGVELEFLLRRESEGLDIEPGTIPSVMERCLLEVETRGLTEVGIYRIAGATSEISALREAFNRGESPITPSTDIHAVCDLVKSWFRVLPEPVFPASAYYNVIDVMKLDDLESRLTSIRRVVQGLPQANFDLLKRVAEHLDKVTDYEENNQMTAEALAIVFSPNLLRAPQNDFALILANMGHTHKLVKALITHLHVIFDDDLEEADNDADDDDIEEPILEEDEEEEDMPSPNASDAED